MTDVEAAIGLAQMDRIDDMLASRRRNAHQLRAGLADIPGLHLQKLTVSEQDHAWHQFCLTIDAEVFGCTRDELIRRLAENGIASAVHYPRCVHQQPVIEELYGQQTLPVSEGLTEKILALPVHHALKTEEVNRIVQAVRKFGNVTIR